MNSVAAMSRLVIPETASSATRCSEGVSPSARRLPDVPGPARRWRGRPTSVRAELFEGVLRFAQRGCGGVAVALSALELAEQQLGAGPFERHWQAMVFGHGEFGRCCCCVEVAACGEQHRAAAQAYGEHPCAVKSAAVAFKGVDQRLGFVEAAKPDQRLSGVGQERGGDDLSGIGPGLHDGQQRFERVQRRLVVTAATPRRTAQSGGPLGQPHGSAALGRRYASLRSRRASSVRPA